MYDAYEPVTHTIKKKKKKNVISSHDKWYLFCLIIMNKINGSNFTSCKVFIITLVLVLCVLVNQTYALHIGMICLPGLFDSQWTSPIIIGTIYCGYLFEKYPQYLFEETCLLYRMFDQKRY